ncbi:uncharacterized protein LOC130591894 [Beta vulgaris subsp. vulgaris]|uniref:uncharacterized protein LOC130591894 n=1 Tax=Beta vulgaris subsp. vulgaris TaxID=3555 RepID=UPI0025476773|nr:uncharacterized protein LOC130591894 [Beta vulgaris subsp. vulgaris]
MRSLNPSGREMEKRIDQSDYEEDILETEELYHSEEEAQGGSRHEYSASGASIAQTWFKSLKPGSISSFSQLSSTFSTHFVSNRRRKRTTGELLFVKQGANESLRDYIGRFNVEAVSIPRLQQDVAGEEFDKAVGNRESEKKEDKQKKDKGREFDRVRDDRRQESHMVKRGDERERDGERYDRDRRDRERKVREGGERKDRFDAYTQLTTSRSQIFLKNKDSDKWQRPKPMFHKNRDKSKWCDFHGDHGHVTKIVVT